MKALNKKAAALFAACVADLMKPGESRRIGDAASGFMPLDVECIGTWQSCRVVSLAHYAEQNGDPMRDPEITFLVGPKGDVFPLTYRNDFVGVDQVAAEPNDEGGWNYHKKLQQDLVYFAQDWLRNIAAQQGL